MQLAGRPHVALVIVGKGVPAGVDEGGTAAGHLAVSSLKAQDVVHGHRVVGLPLAPVGDVDDHGGADEPFGGDALDRPAVLDEVRGSVEMRAGVLPQMRLAGEVTVLLDRDPGLEARRRRARPHGDVFVDGACEIDDALDGDHDASSWSCVNRSIITCHG